MSYATAESKNWDANPGRGRSSGGTSNKASRYADKAGPNEGRAGKGGQLSSNPANATAAAPHPADMGEQALAEYWLRAEQYAAAYRTLADCLVEQGHVAAGITELRHSLEFGAGRSDTYVRLGVLLNQLGQLTESAAACREALRIEPGNGQAHVLLGSVLSKLGEWEGAAEAFKHALSIEPTSYELALALAGILWRLGDWTEAEALYRSCIGLKSTDTRAFAPLVILLALNRRFAEAEEICRAGLERKPDDGELAAMLVRLLARRESREADAYCCRALGSIGDSVAEVGFRSLHAALLVRMGRPNDASRELQAMSTLPGGDLTCLIALGDLAAEEGDRDGARRLYEQAKQVAQSRSGPVVPFELETRLIFCQLPQLADRCRNGTRALIDTTGLSQPKPASLSESELVELFCIVTGQAHCRALTDVAFPALFRSPGFDRLLDERKVVYNLYSRVQDIDELRPFLSRLAELGIGYRLNVELLGLSPHLYCVLCLPLLDQVARSLATGSIVWMAQPDFVFAGSIRQVINDMGHSNEYVISACPRVDWNKAYQDLSVQLRERKRSLSSRELVRKAMDDYRHPQTRWALSSNNPLLRYRRKDEYYAVNTAEPPPFCFRASEEMLKSMIDSPAAGSLPGPLGKCVLNSLSSFFVVDHDFVDIAARHGQLRYIDDSDYLFCAEMTAPNSHDDHGWNWARTFAWEDYYYTATSAQVFAHEARWIF